MSFRKQVIPVSAQLVSLETDIPPGFILKRLDNNLNRDEASQLVPLLQQAKTREEIENGMQSLLKECGFIFFSAIPQHRWMAKYYSKNFPAIVTYTFGNPITAQGIMQIDPRAAVHLPPRLLVLGNENGTGTSILYCLPSSIMKMDRVKGLKEALEGLDAKLENFIVNYVLCDTEDGEDSTSQSPSL
ncbi:hypothetical protein BDN71DRAFT_1424896 [Pleurotus eryngii]|uniref:DUF302 domain-containing protein n=1 Tax=Pleurotus eryngii TaxID=5323 RepID=A0A9P6D221_PLEER|nr:hypothetical protein BDN71DRAFT_1424896 [Pleurotus eryngii]